MKRLTILALLSCIYFTLHAQNDSTEQKKGIFDFVQNIGDKGVDVLTLEREKYTFFMFPMIGYEEQTKFSFGAMPIWRFYLGESNQDDDYYRPSDISPSAMFSTTGMYEFELSSNFYTTNRWIIKTQWLFTYMPDRFYGIGNFEKDAYSDFELKNYVLKGSFIKGLNSSLFLGLNYDISFNDVYNVESDVLTPSVEGYDGGNVFGFGPMLYHDTRNSITFPSTGSYFEVNYSQYFGDFQFYQFEFDARKYLTLWNDNNVLAFQLYYNTAQGDVPFFKLPTLGGKDLFRGIDRPLKYIDNNAMYAQAEFRSHIWWRLGYVLNAGAGNVFSTWDSNMYNNIQLMLGGGLRFEILPEEKLSIRADIGVTSQGEKGIYFTLGEAF